MKFKEVRKKLALLLCAAMALTAVPLTAFGKTGYTYGAGDEFVLWGHYGPVGNEDGTWRAKVTVDPATEFAQLAEQEETKVTFKISTAVEQVATAANAQEFGDAGNIVDNSNYVAIPSGQKLVGLLQKKLNDLQEKDGLSSEEAQKWVIDDLWSKGRLHLSHVGFDPDDDTYIGYPVVEITGIELVGDTVTFTVKGLKEGHAAIFFGPENEKNGTAINTFTYNKLDPECGRAEICVCQQVSTDTDILLHAHVVPSIRRKLIKLDELNNDSNKGTNVVQAVVNTFTGQDTFVKFNIDASVYGDIPGAFVDGNGKAVREIYPKFYITDISVNGGVPSVTFYLDYVVRYLNATAEKYEFTTLTDTGAVDFVVPVISEGLRGTSNKYVKWTHNGGTDGLAMLGEYQQYSIIDKIYTGDLEYKANDDGSTYDEAQLCNYEHAILRTKSIQGTYTMQYVSSIDTYGSVSAGYGVTTYSSNKGTTEKKSTTFGGTWEATSDGKWMYRFSDDSYPKSRWVEITYNGVNNWYYFDENKHMVTGWFKYPMDGNWYYLHPYADGDQGYMYTGWHQIDGVWYYFNETSDGTKGRMYANETTPDGYSVDANGAWIQ